MAASRSGWPHAGEVSSADGLEEVERPQSVDLKRDYRIQITPGGRALGGQVDYEIGSGLLHDPLETSRIQKVALEKADLRLRGREVGDVLPLGDQPLDLQASAQELFAQVGADETGDAGDQDGFGFPGH